MDKSTQIPDKIIEAGDFVYYTSPNCKETLGRVKSLTDDGKAAFVVYNCNNDWDNYLDYTGARTELDQIELSLKSTKVSWGGKEMKITKTQNND